MADKKTSLSPAKNIFKDQRVLLAINSIAGSSDPKDFLALIYSRD